jgi:galactokinase
VIEVIELERSELARRLADLEPDVADRPVEVVRAPGRVNLIGEHTDVNDGFVLPAAIDLEIRIGFAPSDDRRAVLHRLDASGKVMDDGTAAFDLDALPPRSGGWADYAIGMAWAIAQAGLACRGLRGVISSTLPVGAGLSSSAAIEMAVAHALLGDTARDMDPVALAQLGRRAENEFVGVQSGLMDQFASNTGRSGAALLLDCRTLDWRAVPLPLDEISLVVCDSSSPRRLASSEYNIRRAQCQQAVTVLARDDPSITVLRDVSLETVRAAIRDGRLDSVVGRRAVHIVTENERVHATVAALEAGDLAAVGELFAASHASLRDDFEVSSPALDALVEIATGTPGVVGARMTGAGFGGCTINVVRPDAVARLTAAIEEKYPAMTGLTPKIYPVRAVDGAGPLGD